MQENINWYWYQKQQQNVITVPTKTILHTYIDVVAVKYVHDIPRSV